METVRSSGLSNLSDSSLTAKSRSISSHPLFYAFGVGRQSAVKAAIKEGEVLLRLLLVNGNRSDLAVPLSDSVRRVKGRLLAEWPKEWSLEERPGSVEHLRLLYHGRFLEDRLILEELHLPKEQYVTMHLLLKPKMLSEDFSRVKTRRSHSADDYDGACCGFCGIM